MGRKIKISIGFIYTEEERMRRREKFDYCEEDKRVIKDAGYFTRTELNEMGAKPFGDRKEANWFFSDGSIYGRTGCIFVDGIQRFRKLLSEKLLLELA